MPPTETVPPTPIDSNPVPSDDIVSNAPATQEVATIAVVEAAPTNTTITDPEQPVQDSMSTEPTQVTSVVQVNHSTKTEELLE